VCVHISANDTETIETSAIRDYFHNYYFQKTMFETKREFFIEICILLIFYTTAEINIRCYKNDVNQLFCEENLNETGLVGIVTIRNNDVIIKALNESMVLDSVLPNGLQVFQSFSAIHLEIGIKNISSSSFQGINPRKLKIVFGKIGEFSFQSLSKLEYLELFNLNGSAFFHHDSFYGLTNLKELQFKNIKKIIFLSSKEKSDHYSQFLCSLTNLKILKIISIHVLR